MSDCPNCGTQRQQAGGVCYVCGYNAPTVETAEEKRATETAEAPRAKRKS